MSQPPITDASAGSLFQGQPRYVPDTPWGAFTALLVTVAAFGSSFIIGIGAVVVALIMGGPEQVFDSEMEEMFSLANPSGAGIAALTQIVSLAIIWLAAGYRGMRREALQLSRSWPPLSTLLAGGLVLIVAAAALEFAMFKLSRFDILADTEWLRRGLNSDIWWATIIIAVVLAPLWEELAFRGFLLSALAKTRLGFWGAGLVCNIMWSLLHWGYSWQGLASVFLSGIVLTWILWRTGTIRAPIIAHAMANAAAVAFAYLYTGGP